jgi:surfeit locus 1 family protein
MMRASVRARQALVLAAGVLAAVVMLLLGRWQLDVYHAQGARAAAQRAAAPPVALTTVAPAGSAVTEGFGRSVSFAGSYDARNQELLPVAGEGGRYRVLTPLRQADGSVVPVVRGISGSPAPPPPSGQVSQVGVLLPSENPDTVASPVNVPLLAQRWPGPLVDGYVTLAPSQASGQGLAPLTVALPSDSGRLQNGAYALQWWVFAGFALVFAVRIARDLDRRSDLDLIQIEMGSAARRT